MTPITDPSTNITRLPAAAFRWTVIGAPLLILFAAYLLTSGRLTATPQAAKQNKPLATTDDWRRTANGWERTHSWPTATSHSWPFFDTRNPKANTSKTSSRAAARPPRLDTHPAALALVQLLASVFALTLFRNPHQNPLRLSSLLATVSRSFRSSAFGS